MMRRFDSDLDYFAAVNGEVVHGEPNATCTDCGADFSKGEHDPTTLCDPCSDRRDAHTSALEVRLMAKAVLRADLTRLKEIA